MGVVRFCVIFDKPDNTYYPGEMVTGRVELVLNAVKKIKGVELKLKGRAKCQWSDTETYHDHEGKSQTRTVHRRGCETYLKNEQILVGGRSNFELPAGEHTYPFAVMLPIKLPSTYNGTYGGISYYAKAKIDIPMAFDKTERAGFTVINRLNLNLYPNLRNPYKNEKSKTFCCLCCASGPLTIVVMIPKTGFATTESIPITLEIDNASNVAVNAVHVYLKRDIRWKAEGDHKEEQTQLQKLRLGAVAEGQSHTWSENFTIPPTPFPFLDNCSIINLDHKLHIEADASGMHSDLDMHIPITIGDVPLSEDPNAPIATPQIQTYPNMAYNPGMQPVSPGGIPTNPANYPYPGNQPGPPFGVPGMQICPQAPPGHIPQYERNGPPTPGFVTPSGYPNPAAMPPIPPQGYPQSNYPSGGYPPAVNPIPNQQYPSPQASVGFPPLPQQPATNPECTQNSSHPPAPYSGAGDGFTLPSFDTNVQLQNTSFLDDSKNKGAENATVTSPLLPSSSPTAPPPS